MNEKVVEFFTPYDKQAEVIEALEDPNVTTVVVCAGRQAGKTIIAENMAVKWCLDAPQKKPIKVMWLSPTDSQCNKVYQELIKVFPKKHFLVKNIRGAKGDTEIVFKNGSRILFRSAGSEDTLRGNSIHYLIIDEAAFIKEATITDIVLPTMSVAGRKKLIISTPKGKNWFHTWYMNGFSSLEDFTEWKSFHFNCYDSPFITDKIIRQARAISTNIKFRQEYEAEFVDSASCFNNLEEVMTLESNDWYECIPDVRYYAGVDIGLGKDATVVSIIDQFGNFVKYYKIQETQAQVVINDIIKLNKEWKFKKILFETNNNGLPMYQKLRETLSNIEAFSTQTKTKSQIVERLIFLFDTYLENGFRVLQDSDFQVELEGFNFKNMGNGAVKYGAASGFHDDIIMATAIARYCYDKSQYNSRYVGFF